jgi:acyl transferase domain-containing protein
VLDKPEWFDAGFFGFTPREAELTDPQQRVFLECAWTALEDGGLDPERYGGSVGVFAGASMNTYLLDNIGSHREQIAEFVTQFQTDGYPLLLGNDKDYLATRCAYKFNLHGPAITVQTACSTSLVAVVQAVNALLAYQCDAALAGGVSISFPQERGHLYQDGAIASGNGHTRAFDADAQGTVFGSGCGIVLLKRLKDALADGDHIYATIRGAAVNNDGSDKVSYVSPRREWASRGHFPGARPRRCDRRHDRLCRGAWDSDATGRSNRGECADAGFSRYDGAHALLSSGHSEDQCRAP